MQTAFVPEQLIAASPEIFLAIAAMLFLMIGVFTKKDTTDFISILCVATLGLACALVTMIPDEVTGAFDGAFILDPFARFLKVLTYGAAAAAIILSMTFNRRANIARFEFSILILLASLGMGMMISANDLISLYMGLELQSLALYVIAAFNRESSRSSEAGLKYFVLGALSSGMLLYGCSLIYGFTGTTSFPAIAGFVAAHGGNLGLIFGIVFLLAGLAFKVSAVPFHMWTPDVYEGASTPVTALFASAPKIAAMAMFIRAMIAAFPAIADQWQQIIVFISIASMVLGAFAAIGQRNIKRLMGYSSIGHMGFALVGLAAGTESGIKGVIIYLAIYLAMTLGTFGCILAMRRQDEMFEDIDDLAGLGRTSPLMGFILAMLMFSLAGIPPLAGFFAKWYVFLAAIQSGLYPLAIIGIVASVVGAFYYLRIIKIIYFDEPADAFDPMPRELALIVGLSSLFVMLFFVFPTALTTAAEVAAKSLF